MRHAPFTLVFAMIAATVLSGCNETKVAQDGTGGTSGGTSSSPSNRAAALFLPSGTSIDVALSTKLTSETASVGDAWTGSTRNAVMVDGRTVVPAGSTVHGTVTSVTPARKGDRAMLDLAMTSVSVGGDSHRVHGTMESVIAGSTRARNLGAIGAATVAGAVVGQQVGGSTKGTVVGGVIGGAAATAAVSQSKGWQVVLKQGTPLTFTTNESVAVRP